MFSDSQLNPDLSPNQNQANGNISLNENMNGSRDLIATSNMPPVPTSAEEGQIEGQLVPPCSTSTATFSAPAPAPRPVATQMEAEVPTGTGQINGSSDLTVPALQAGQGPQGDLRLQNSPADNNSIDNIEIDIIDLNASNSSGSSNSSSSVVGSSGDTANSVVSLNFNQSSNSSAADNPLPSIDTIMNGSDNGGGNEIREISVNQNHNGDAIQIISIQQIDENPERAEIRNQIHQNNLSPENGNNDIDIFNNQNQAQNPAPQIAAAGFDEQAEEFRRRFFQAILRRDAQPVESPPEYEEFDEDDNIDLIEDIADDDDTYDGVSTGPPSPREDRGDSDEHGQIEREEVSSVPVFDLQLPTRHSYLGDEMEALHGRTIMEGGAIAQIPLVLLDFHLVPGQTLPLTVFHAVTQSALRNCVPNHRHFGIVHSGLNDSHIRAPLPRRALGTTAEIYEFQEEREAPFRLRHRQPPSVNIKAKGRHRFNVLSTYRQSDGHLVAKVKIRPEINLPKFWRNITSPGHRHLFPGTGSSSGSVVHSSIKGCASRRRSSSSIAAIKRRGKSPAPTASKSQTHVALADSSVSVSVAVDDSSDSEMRAEESHGLEEGGPESSSSKSQNPEPTTGSGKGGSKSILTELSGRLEVNRKKTKYYSAMMSWPYFVYEQFDEEVLVEKIHRKLSTELSSLVAARVVVPQDATDLSFWLAQNLTMSDDLRLQMLKMDTPIERLRFANKLLDKVSRVIECNQCQGHHGQGVIANHSDIFSMSVEGPQGTYVNPHGCVHELITVTKIRGIVYRGHPSTESSWFPGYSWRICECRTCGNHIGWKFEAVEKLKPTKFWGVARRSVSFKYDFSIENDCPDLDAPTPSVISNTRHSANNNNNHRNNNNTVLRRNVSESSQDNEVI